MQFIKSININDSRLQFDNNLNFTVGKSLEKTINSSHRKIQIKKNFPLFIKIEEKLLGIKFKHLKELGKVKLSVMNTSSALITFFCLNPLNGYFMPYVLFTMGTLGMSMSSQMFNQISENKYDKKMLRTKNRPLALGLYSDNKIKKIANVLIIYSSLFYLPLHFYGFYPLETIIFSLGINGIYNFAYTPLKRYNNMSMHIGALVGALVPILGAIAAIGQVYHPLSIVFAIFTFAWQYPHFYGIAYKHKQCYANAGFEFISKYPFNNYKSFFQIIISLIIMIMCFFKLYSLGKIPFLPILLAFGSILPFYNLKTYFISNPRNIMFASYPVYLLMTLCIIFAKYYKKLDRDEILYILTRFNQELNNSLLF
jgi:heme O synthase-like polyprenyltransferase